MTNLMKIEQNLTMTSREIAELTGKRHDNVVRDTREMLVELYGEEGLLNFEDTYINPQNGQHYPMFALPKRETLILVSGYNLAMRAKIIDRWQELEAQVAKHLTTIEMFALSAKALTELEQRTKEVEHKQQQVQNKLLQIDNKITTGLEEVKETNLLTSCPTAAESISAIRLRMNKEYGLSASVVDQVMRQSVYAPKPVGMVRNTHESSGGSTYAVYWKKDVSAVFKRFVKECVHVGNGDWFKHDWVGGKFKMSVLWCNM